MNKPSNLINFEKTVLIKMMLNTSNIETFIKILKKQVVINSFLIYDYICSISNLSSCGTDYKSTLLSIFKKNKCHNNELILY